MEERIQRLCKEIAGLSINQVDLIDQIIEQLKRPYIKLTKNLSSDLITDDVLKDFGDALRIHHCFSYEPFTKDKFEYALERVLSRHKYDVHLAPHGNPGHDIEINSTKFSLKTQADKELKINKLHISKFMELGKGQWGDDPKDLSNLLTLFFKHLEGYERIFSLRCISKNLDNWHYELVEIPKSVLTEARNGILRMNLESRQSPKPGYCDVFDDNGKIKFQLYFDGGSERKLQVKNLNKEFCLIHAEWSFERRSI